MKHLHKFQNHLNESNDNELKYDISYNVYTNLYYATLLNGEFSNCYGQGETEDDAITSLKIRVKQLRNKKHKKHEVNTLGIKCLIEYDFSTERYKATLLDDEYPECYEYGNSENDAIIGLKTKFDNLKNN